MPSLELEQRKRAIIDAHVRPADSRGWMEVLTTLVPLAALWVVAVQGARVSSWVTIAMTMLIGLFVLRAFVLMHECGHGSLFRSGRLNRVFGFAFGVIVGMPQYVWSRNHQYHHSTNGDWEKFRGVLNTCSVDEYEGWSLRRRRSYRRARNIWTAPFAGLMYLIVYPRLNWLAGTVGLLCQALATKSANPAVPMADIVAGYKTKCWDSVRSYRHMTWNNIAVCGLYVVLSWLLGTVLFFSIYAVSVALAGAAGIILFTVQHNFEHAYATDSTQWDADRGALQGTSLLVLPGWLNWVTANIGYHHVHHLSAAIPGYHLVACHRQYQHLFTDVRRISLRQIPAHLKCILWDRDAARIISIVDHDRQRAGR